MVSLVLAARRRRPRPPPARDAALRAAHQRDVVATTSIATGSSLLAAAAFAGNLFVAPASFFQNRYLEDVRGYTGGGIALFTIATATPAGIGILVGGRLADRYGRRILGSVCARRRHGGVPRASFGVAGRPMWLAAMFGGLILGGVACPPSACTAAELFPTGRRGLAAVHGDRRRARSAAASACSSPAALLDRGASHVEVIGVFALGQLVVAAIVLAGVPGDRPPRARGHQPGGRGSSSDALPATT